MASEVEDHSAKVEQNGAGKEIVNAETDDDNVIEILNEASEKVADKVELSGLQIRSLPQALWKLHHLVVLNISHNQLEKLEELYLSSNTLKTLPDSLGLLTSLKILDVSGNKLNTLPETIVGCRSLVELDASFNELVYLPINIGHGLVNLEKLCLQLNRIQAFPISICEMRSLRYLDAHFNELHSLPSEIGRLTKLEVLNLSSNFKDLTEIPESIGNLINLRELDLSNNQIHVLPATFYKLDCLVELHLDQNPLVFPPLEVANKDAQYVKEFIMKREIDNWRRETIA